MCVCVCVGVCDGVHVCVYTEKKIHIYLYMNVYFIYNFFHFVLSVAWKMYKPEYSIEPRLAASRPDPSSKPRRFDIKPGGSEPGPDGDGICLPEAIPGDGARRGGVARPNPESVSGPSCVLLMWRIKKTSNSSTSTTTTTARTAGDKQPTREQDKTRQDINVVAVRQAAGRLDRQAVVC